MWIEIDGLEETEHEGVKCFVVLVNIDTGLQIVKRIREHATDEKGDTKNRYQLVLRNLSWKWQLLKAAESWSELDRELNKLKGIIREKEGGLLKV